jgi:chromate transporter
VLLLGIAYFGSHAVPEIQDILRGVTVAAIGLAMSMGFKTGERYKTNFTALLFIAAAFVASIVLKVPLLAVLAVLAPLAFLIEMRRARESTE